LKGQCKQHMPGHAIILAVRVAVPEHQRLVQTLPAVAGALDVILQIVNGAFVFIIDRPHHITNGDEPDHARIGNHRQMAMRYFVISSMHSCTVVSGFTEYSSCDMTSLIRVSLAHWPFSSPSRA